MLYAADFRRIARQALKGRWGVAVLAGFIASLLGGAVAGGSSAVLNLNVNEEDVYFYSDWLNSEQGQLLFPILTGIGIVLLAWGIVIAIVGGAISLNYAKFNLNLADGQPAAAGDLFTDLRIGAGFCMRFLRGLYIFLWSLLFIIPGILASFSYALTPYIMAEHPEYGANEAIRISKEMMKGNRWRLFCLNISFIGWSILSAFTLGIGSLWLHPYMESANAIFYREISGTVPSYQAGQYDMGEQF